MPRSTEPIGGQFRAGGRVLPLLADAVNVAIVRALRQGELRGPELTDRLEHISRTTQFERLKDLEEMKVIARETLSVVPRQSVYRLTEPGERLLPAAAPLEAWLAQAGPAPLRLGEAGATEPVKALASALNSTILRWLAEANRSPTELERLVQDGGYLDLKRTLRALKRSALVEQQRGSERRHPYELTDWALRAATPIVAMIRWESDHVPELASPLTPLDVESLLLLAARSLDPPSDRSGRCVFVVEGLGAVSVVIQTGTVTRCMPGVEHGLANWARGSVAGWRAAILGGTFTALEVHGDIGFTNGLVTALCETLH
jgi:DNA-binding HxlR family transcriptional regulator